MRIRPPWSFALQRDRRLNGAPVLASPSSLDHTLLRGQSAARTVMPLSTSHQRAGSRNFRGERQYLGCWASGGRRHLSALSSGVGASANFLHVLALCVSVPKRRLFPHCAALRKLRSRPGQVTVCDPTKPGQTDASGEGGKWGVLACSPAHAGNKKPFPFSGPGSRTPPPAYHHPIPCLFATPNDDLGGGSHCSVEFPFSTGARLLPPPRRLEPPHTVLH